MRMVKYIRIKFSMHSVIECHHSALRESGRRLFTHDNVFKMCHALDQACALCGIYCVKNILCEEYTV